jgi:hypothetical protein
MASSSSPRARVRQTSQVASYTVNERAVARARALIESRQYVLNSDWREVQPKAEGEMRISPHTRGRSTVSGISASPKGLRRKRTRDTRSSTETSVASIEQVSSPATTAQPSGGTKRSNLRRTSSCSSSTSPAPDCSELTTTRFRPE